MKQKTMLLAALGAYVLLKGKGALSMSGLGSQQMLPAPPRPITRSVLGWGPVFSIHSRFASQPKWALRSTNIDGVLAGWHPVWVDDQPVPPATWDNLGFSQPIVLFYQGVPLPPGWTHARAIKYMALPAPIRP